MRFYIHSTNRSLDEIDGYSEDYPEYALLEVNKILKFIKEKDVKVEHFQQVSVDEMRYAQEVAGPRPRDKKIIDAADVIAWGKRTTGFLFRLSIIYRNCKRN